MIPPAATLLALAPPATGAKPPVGVPGDGFAGMLALVGKTVCPPPEPSLDAVVDEPPIPIIADRQIAAAAGDPLPAGEAVVLEGEPVASPGPASLPIAEPPFDAAEPRAPAGVATAAISSPPSRSGVHAAADESSEPPTTNIDTTWAPEPVRGDREKAEPSPYADGQSAPVLLAIATEPDVAPEPASTETGADADHEPRDALPGPIVPMPIALSVIIPASGPAPAPTTTAPTPISATSTAAPQAVVAAPEPAAPAIDTPATAPLPQAPDTPRQTLPAFERAMAPTARVIDATTAAPLPQIPGTLRPTPPAFERASVAAPIASVAIDPSTTDALRARINVAFRAAATQPAAIEPVAIDTALPVPPVTAAPAIEPLAALQSAAPVTPPVTAPLDTRNDGWMTAMIDRIETLRDTPGTREMRVRLTPDALGGIEVRLRETPEGMQVHLTAETPAARALLAEAAPRLSDMAEARGVKLAQQGTDANGGQPGQPRDTESQRPRRNPSPATTAGDEPLSEQRIA